MKRKVLSALLAVVSMAAYGQKKFDKGEFKLKMDSKPGQEVVCPASHIDENTYIGMSDKVQKAISARKNLRPVATNSADFEVLYDPAMPQVAQEAFQRAVDIWAELLNSNVKINVIALWQELGPSVLGSAGPGTYFRNFSGSTRPNTWYPIALAEKLSGEELNDPDDFDIVARFSSDQNWYYGTTGTPAVGQFDFTSVVLHELCHGLGFVGSMDVTGTQGSFGLGTDVPVIFDSFIINEKEESIIDTLLFPNPSTALRNELISENLFFNSPLAVANNNDDKVKLYAPTIFDSGSSISHLDDKTYPAGTLNSLMTPTAGLRETNFVVGDIVLDMFTEMGWKGTSIIHEPLKDFQETSEVLITAKIFSDTSLVAGTAMLNYIELDTETATQDDLDAGLAAPIKLPMTLNTTSGEYEAIIPVSDPTSVFVYYLSVNDDLGNMVTSPPDAPNFYWLFEVGLQDQWGPILEYYPPTIVGSGQPIDFVVNASDDFQAGIDTVFVEYAINGIAQPAFGLERYNAETDVEFSQGSADERAFIAAGGIPDLQENDVVTLSVTARDVAGNETTIPTTAGGTSLDDPTVPDLYEFVATVLLDPITEDFVNFDEPTEVIAATGFDIQTPSGLTSGALQSHSPYKNGLGLYDPVSGDTYLDFDYNAIALYRHPIIIKADSATISFDEIVLVEPGAENAVYGDSNFWDYVIVEGSVAGEDWTPLVAGYDSGADEAWSNLFTTTLAPSDVDNPTSNGVPTPGLYRTREINIYDTYNAAAAGELLLIRFRLYGDQWVNGWGWAIDNLSIQKPAPKPLASEGSAFDLRLSPNPTVDYVDVNARLASKQGFSVQVYQMNGTKVYDAELDDNSSELAHRINTKEFVSGSYIVRLKGENGLQQSKRFMINK